MLADVGPDAEEDALSLVVAGPVVVGLAEVAGHDRAVDGLTIWLRVISSGGRANT